MKITNLDRVSIKFLRAAIDAALKTVGETHGLTIAAGNANFDSRGKSATFKLEVAVIGEDGVAYSPIADDFKRHAAIYGLKPELLNETFGDLRGKSYKVVGFDVKRRTKPFVIECTKTGKQFIAPAEMLQSGFKDRLSSNQPGTPLSAT